MPSNVYRTSPQSPASPRAAVTSPMNATAAINGLSPLVECDPRRRHFSGSSTPRASLLSGLREFLGRPRSESLGTQLMKKPLKKVQIHSCKLDSVYDLREDCESENEDIYNDGEAFRRPRSNSSDFLILRKTSRPLSVDVVGLVDGQTDPYRQYLKVVDCYELAPTKGTLVVLDKNLDVLKGLRSLSTNGVGAALVWDGDKGKMTSMLTFTDFFTHYQSAESIDCGKKLADILTGNRLVTVPSEMKVWSVCEEFCMSQIHRVAVMDEQTNSPLYILNIRRVLQAVHRQNRSLHFVQWLGFPIEDTGIGRWNTTIHSVNSSDTLSKALQMMLGFRLSSLPVLNEKGQAYEVLRKTDIAEAMLRFDSPKKFFAEVTVEAILPTRDTPLFASPNTPVSQVLGEMLSEMHCRCMFVVDQNKQPIACVSLSDLLHYLVYEEMPFSRKISVTTLKGPVHHASS